MVKVVPRPNNGSSELVQIRKDDCGETFWIFQKLKYTFDAEKRLFRAVEFPADQSCQHYLEWKGYEDDETLAKAERHYGNNK